MVSHGVVDWCIGLFGHGCHNMFVLKRLQHTRRRRKDGKEMPTSTVTVTCQNCGRTFEIEAKEKSTLAELEVFVCNKCNHDGSFGEKIHEAERCLE